MITSDGTKVPKLMTREESSTAPPPEAGAAREKAPGYRSLFIISRLLFSSAFASQAAGRQEGEAGGHAGHLHGDASAAQCRMDS